MHKHIINGLSAAACLRQYLREPLGNFALFQDSLILGPLSSFQDPEKFISERTQFWKDCFFDDDDDFFTYLYKEFLDHILSADSYTLWLSPGGHDQFMWAWLVHVFHLNNIDWKTVQVKHLFNDENARFPYMGLGELNPERFSLCKDFDVTREHLLALRETYDALISNTPESLLDICSRKEFPLPQLQKSLKVYLKSFPDYQSGLNVFDRALLANCKDIQQKSARIIAEGMMYKEYEDCFAISDSYLFRRLFEMTQQYSKHPLIHLHGTIKNSSSMRFTEVNITDLGKEVLSGKKNYVELNGIDESIGGIHLSSLTNTGLWFYKEGTLVRDRNEKEPAK